MPKDVTVTFSDGTTHVYQNAPDNLTPDQVEARAQKDFGKSVKALSRGSAPQQPQRRTFFGDLSETYDKINKDATSNGGNILAAGLGIGMDAVNGLTRATGGLIGRAAYDNGLGFTEKPVLEHSNGHARVRQNNPVTVDASESAGEGLVNLASFFTGAGEAQGAKLGAKTNALMQSTEIPLRLKRVKALQEAGIQLTPGQLSGGVLQNLEDAVATTSGSVRAAKVRANEALNSAVINDAVSPIGGKVEGAGRDAIAQMHEGIGDALNTAFGKANFSADDAFHSAVNQAARDHLLPTDRQEASQLASEFVADASHGDGLSQSFARLNRMKVNATRAGKGSLGDFIHDLQQAALDAVDRGGGASEDVRKARDAFRRSVVPERAAAMVGAPEGVFDANQLVSAVKASDRTVRSNAFAQGKAQYQDIAEAAKDVMGKTIGSSGTAERASLTDPVRFVVLNARNLALKAVYNRTVIGALNRISQAKTPPEVNAALQSLGRMSKANKDAARALQALNASHIQAGLPPLLPATAAAKDQQGTGPAK